MPARPVRGLAAVTVLAVSLTACSSSGGGGHSSRANPYGLITPGVLTAATDPSQPPFASAGADGKVSGFVIDVTDDVARRLHLTVSYKATGVTSELAGLTSGQYDIAASGLGDTAEREQTVAFAKPLFWSTTVVLTKHAGTATTSSFSGKRVGVVTGAAQESFVAAMSGAQATHFQTSNAGIQQLLNGNIDAFAIGGPDAQQYMKQYPSLHAAVTAPVDHPTSVALPKNRAALRTAVDGALAAMVTDGTYATLYRKSFTTPPTPQLLAAWPALKAQFASGS